MTIKQIREIHIDYLITKTFLDKYCKLGTLEEVRSKLEDIK